MQARSQVYLKDWVQNHHFLQQLRIIVSSGLTKALAPMEVSANLSALTTVKIKLHHQEQEKVERIREVAAAVRIAGKVQLNRKQLLK